MFMSFSPLRVEQRKLQDRLAALERLTREQAPVSQTITVSESKFSKGLYNSGIALSNDPVFFFIKEHIVYLILCDWLYSYYQLVTFAAELCIYPATSRAQVDRIRRFF